MTAGVIAVIAAMSATLSAQWPSYPTPGVPRTADGKPILEAPTPRTPEGKVDFSGIWLAGRGGGGVGGGRGGAGAGGPAAAGAGAPAASAAGAAATASGAGGAAPAGGAGGPAAAGAGRGRGA